MGMWRNDEKVWTAKSQRRTLALQVLTFLVLTFLASPVFAGEAPGAEVDPVAVYSELDGAWAGEFVGWDEKGEELYRIQVRQEYRTVDAETQEVVITDTLADGTVIRGRGRNIARRRADGSLELLCIVEKSNGDRVEHRGRLIRGPGGEGQLVWWSQEPDRTETFREVVRGEGESAVYSIDGVGRYGGSTVVMAGRYRPVE